MPVGAPALRWSSSAPMISAGVVLNMESSKKESLDARP
jgi:hypothetical protein